MSEVRAWIRPLKPIDLGERWQYFVSTPESYAHGSAFSRWAAHDLICDIAYGDGYTEGWEIEEKPPLGKWAMSDG